MSPFTEFQRLIAFPLYRAIETTRINGKTLWPHRVDLVDHHMHVDVVDVPPVFTDLAVALSISALGMA